MKQLPPIAAALSLLPGAVVADETTSTSLTLVDEGRPQYVIVTADEPTAAAQSAVEELNYWINRISGTALSVTTVSQWDKKQPYIAVGASRLTHENGWEEGDLAQEEARVFITSKGIGLLGNDHSNIPGVEWTGTYYAVLEFARKALDVYWVWPGASGEVFTPRKTITVDSASWTWAPDILLNRTLRNGLGKQPSFESVKALNLTLDEAAYEKLEQEQGHWLRRERMNKPSPITFGHAFSDWWELHSAKHPDWFAKAPEGTTQRGGKGVKLNLSNPEVADQIVREWAELRKNDPVKGRYMSVAPNDSRGFDTRPETRAWDAPEMAAYSEKDIFNGGEPILSDRYVRFWNRLSEKASAIDPEVRVTSYAYRNYRKPPLTDIRFTGNTILAYVGPEGYYPDEPFILDEWKEWAKRGAQMAWRPNVFHSGHGVPYLYSKQIFEDFQAFRANALCSTDFDSLVGQWSNQALNYYIVAELHNRPTATYEELANEYYNAFGPAAGAMREYHELFEARTRLAPDLMRKHNHVPNLTWGGWWKGHIRLVPLFMDDATVAKGRELIDKAKADAAGKAEIFQERVAFIEAGFEHAVLMAKVFSELNLQSIDETANLRNARQTLRPLWQHRHKMFGQMTVPVARMFHEEQRQLGIWESYLRSSQRVDGTILPIQDGWSIRLDAKNQGVKSEWVKEAVDTPGWQPVEVAKPWRRALESEEKSRIVWYRTTFEVPELEDTGERVHLCFASVDAEVKVWVNGQLVVERGYPHNGNYDSWNEPFEVDITTHIEARPGNRLVVRVESESQNAGVTGNVTLRIGR